MNALLQLDERLFTAINAAGKNPVFDVVMPFVTKLDHFLIPLAVAWILLFWKGSARTRATLLVVLLAVGASDLVASHIIKPLVGRLRPCHVVDAVNLYGMSCKSSFSFPSSHATNIAAACMVLGLGFRRWWLVPILVVAALAVGYSRAYVGLHYPFDALGGWTIGAALGAAIYPLIPRLAGLRFLSMGERSRGRS